MKSSKAQSNPLKNSITKNWLTKRYYTTSKNEYRYTKQELERINQLWDVFKDYDKDGDGTLDLEEVYIMFLANGFSIRKNDLIKFFQVFPTKKYNCMNFEEFKKFSFDPKSNLMFKKIMHKIKYQYQLRNPHSNLYIPLELPDMLKMLYMRNKQKELLGSLQLIHANDDLSKVKEALDIIDKNNRVNDKNDFAIPNQRTTRLFKSSSQTHINDKVASKRSRIYEEYLQKQIETAKNAGRTQGRQIIITRFMKMRSPVNPRRSVHLRTLSDKFTLSNFRDLVMYN